MTSIPSLAFHEIAPPHLEDQMEIASSPYRPSDDFDFDLDPMRDQSVEPQNDMIDDDIEGAPIQPDITEPFEDDDMLDEYHQENDIEDLNMEADDEQNNLVEDEEILYDDEDGDEIASATMVDETNHGANEVEEIVDVHNGPNYTEDIAAIEANEPQEEDVTATNNQEVIDTDEPIKHGQDHRLPENEQNSISVQDVDEVILHAPDILEAKSPRDVDNIDTEEQPPNEGTPFASPNAGLAAQLEPIAHPLNAAETETGDEENQHTSNSLTDEDAGLITKGSKLQAHDTEDTGDVHLAYLHPVHVMYLGQEMSLFPPLNSEDSATFFLSDPTLAYDSFEKLLGACREVLGGSLEHDDEIVLDVPALGLHICEDSKYASQLSLSQVIDTYMLLSQNEQISHIDPLFCQLSSRVSLVSQVTYIASCAREGKSFSDVAADYLDTPEPDSQTEADDGLGVADTAASYQDAPDVYDAEAGHHEGPSHEEPEESTVRPASNDVDRAQMSEPPMPTIDPTVDVPVESRTSQEGLDTLKPINSEDSVLNTESDTAAMTATVGQDVTPDNALTAELQPENGPETEGETESRSSHTVEAEEDIFAAPSVVKETSNEIANDQDFTAAQEPLISTATEEDDADLGEDEIWDEGDGDYQQPTTQLASEGHHSGSLHVEDYLEEDDLNFDESDEEVDTDIQAQTVDELLISKDKNAEEIPNTPSKLQNGKRKIMDGDDEIDLFDLSTPEPKRSRAS